jgi:hypothetical protein
MIMSPGLRRFALTMHMTCSVGSLGAVAAFLALAVAGLVTTDARLQRAANLAMRVTAWLVVAPLILASLVTGIVQALGTTWGLVRHYWILAKLVLTVLVGIVLLLQMNLIGHLADAAAGPEPFAVELSGLRRSPVLHAVGGFLVLLLTVALSVYKPRGMTRYGWRKHHHERTTARS